MLHLRLLLGSRIADFICDRVGFDTSDSYRSEPERALFLGFERQRIYHGRGLGGVAVCAYKR